MVAMTNTAQQLAEALEDILDPIGYLRKRLQPDERLDSHAAMRAIERPELYQQIAREAISIHRSRQADTEEVLPGEQALRAEAQRGMVDGLQMALSTLEVYGLCGDVSAEQIRKQVKAVREALAAYRQQQAAAGEAPPELEEWRKLRDPVVLHANLLRGIPALLTESQLRHLIGEKATGEAGQALTDERIDEAVTAAVRNGSLSWVGFKKDSSGEYTVPQLSPYHYQLFRVALATQASPPQSTQGEAPLKAIGELLAQAMDQAVRNGANSVSMPDEYVEIAAWLSGVHKAQPATDGQPQQVREPLTEEQIVMDGLMMCRSSKLDSCADAFEAGVRFAECAHGITSTAKSGEPAEKKVGGE